MRPRFSHASERRGGRSRALIRSLAGTATAVLAAVVLAAGLAGGTYAYWIRSASVNLGTIETGTAGLAVTPSSISVAGLYPTATRHATATVKNTGKVPLALRVDSLTGPGAATALSSSLTIGAGVVASTGACAAGWSPTWSGSFASASAGALDRTLAAGESVTLCVSTAMAASAGNGAQNSSTSYTLTISGSQVP